MSPAPSTPVMPMIQVESVDEARDFFVQKLGFEHRMGVIGKDGKLDFVNVALGGASIMFSRSPAGEGHGKGPKPVDLYVNVGDVDKHHAMAKANGVNVAEPLTDQWWGDRTYVIQDPNGYRVWFFTHKAEPVPPPGTKIV